MIFSWLKRYMPRSLYGRAAMILLLPVVALQLVVTTAFIQRHFEGVTEQMTVTTAREINMMIDAVNEMDETTYGIEVLEEIADGLEFRVVFGVTEPVRNQRRWYDFSGLVIVNTLATLVPEVRKVEMPDNRIIRIYAMTDEGISQFQFNRSRVSARNPHQLLVVMVFFGGLMTVIAYLYLRNQLRPITRLAHAAEAFGRGRHVPYTPGGAIEVRAAGSAFVDMRSRIERQIDQRTMMLSGVSHDLRTPLTRLKLGLSLLDSEEAEPLQRDVEDMQRMLDEFLNFARGASEGDPEEVDPVSLVRDLVDNASRGGRNVTLGKAEGDGTISLRVVAIKRAVENLVSNAVRYGTRAVVSVELTDKFLRIRVEDDGPGIAPEDREEALKPFARLDTSRNLNQGTGVGLGLSIAADIARAHGGVLRLAESETLGGLSADIVIGR